MKHVNRTLRLAVAVAAVFVLSAQVAQARGPYTPPDLPHIVNSLPVDTHVGRVSRRLGVTRQEDPDKVEAELTALLPAETWGRAHQLLIWHGRRTCIARKPHCSRCVVAQECPRVGVVTSD